MDRTKPTDREKMGQRLRMARRRKKLSQLELAFALEDYGVTLNQTAIGKIERGERNLYVHQLVSLLNILDVSCDWALKGGDTEVS